MTGAIPGPRYQTLNPAYAGFLGFGMNLNPFAPAVTRAVKRRNLNRSNPPPRGLNSQAKTAAAETTADRARTPNPLIFITLSRLTSDSYYTILNKYILF